MNTDSLIQLMENRFNTLTFAREQAFLSGDIERVSTLDLELNNTRDTINKLKLLNDITQVALETSTPESEIISNGIKVTRNPVSFEEDKKNKDKNNEKSTKSQTFSANNGITNNELPNITTTTVETFTNMEDFEAALENYGIENPQ